MQHAVGSPLPPPHQPGHGPAAGWSPAAHHPGQHPQGPPPDARRPRIPAPPPCGTGARLHASAAGLHRPCHAAARRPGRHAEPAAGPGDP
ncbi:Pro-rich N-terminal domain-containing protein [Streptomyces tendae]|uniref:Pro-rich N-terminal domain-containing protein n=1 Tax=Streptomyces tendae TaxID=1932 RepID=UPI003D65DF16